MRPIEDKGCVNSGTTQDVSNASCISFEFQKSNGITRTPHHHRTALGKPTPSKWDDAQKWLVNLSRGEKHPAKASPRNSNADDRRLIAPVPKKDYSSDEGENSCSGSTTVEKNVDCEESVWRINKPVDSSKTMVRSISVRDMGTEMTPITSQEPSRAATPIRATSPKIRSPIPSGPSTPIRFPIAVESGQSISTPSRTNGSTGQLNRDGYEENVVESNTDDQPKKLSPLETRAVAWDEAERAKYTARYKREEVKIQAWENHQKRKAEMNMKKVEVKAERLKSRAQEKYTNKLASTKRIAEEKRANAEAKLNEKAVKTSERADYIRRTGHLPSSFSIKFPSFCW